MRSDPERAEGLASRRELSELAGVRRETITTWASRHGDFPKPVSSAGQELFPIPRFLAWAESRTIPAKSLREGEAEGTTYADRVRRVLRGRRTASRPAGPVDDGHAAKALTELFGPIADRVRGTGPQDAYLSLLLTLVFVRGRDRSAWAHVRDLVHVADQEQREPGRVLRGMGTIADDVLRAEGQMPWARAALEKLRPEATEDISHVVHQCERLGRESFRLLLDRFERWTKPDGAGLFTPRGVTALLADILCSESDGPQRCYDPYVRGGEGLVAMAERLQEVSVFGESSQLASLQLAGMNMALHGLEPNLGGSTAPPWGRPEWPNSSYDRVFVNPPFNQKVSVPRNRTMHSWPFGSPPAKSDTYAWLQYVYRSLAPGGVAGVVMPNRAAVTDDDREHAIRGRMIERGAVQCVIWLPRGLFMNTPIAATIWILSASDEKRDEILLIDARTMGSKDGKHRVLSDEECGAIVSCYQAWAKGQPDFSYVLQDAGTAVSIATAEIGRRGDSLDPSDYVESARGFTRSVTAAPRPAAVLDSACQRAAYADRHVDDLRVRERDAFGGEFPDGWRTAPLGELCDIQTGPTHGRLKLVLRSDDGVPLIVRAHLRDRRILADGAQRLDPDAVMRLRRFALEPGDVLCVRTGSTGPVALVAPEQAGSIFDSGLTRLRCAPTGDLDPGYLLAFLSLPVTQKWINDRAATATAIDSIGGKTLGRLRVVLPPLDEQLRIGSALRAMDDQIAAHRDLAETAERARAALAANLITGPLTVQ